MKEQKKLKGVLNQVPVWALLFAAFFMLTFVWTEAYADTEKGEADAKVKVGVLRLLGDDQDASLQKQIIATLQPDPAGKVPKGGIVIRELTAPLLGTTPEEQERSAREIAKKENVSIIVGGEVQGEEFKPVVMRVSSYDLSPLQHPISRLPERVALPTQSIKTPLSLVRLVHALAFLEGGDPAAEPLFDLFLATLVKVETKGDLVSYVAGAFYKAYAETHHSAFLRSAVNTYRKALKAYQEEKNGIRQADIQHDMGVSLRMLASLGVEPEKNLRLAVMTTLEAMHFRKKQGTEEYAASEKNLAQSYAALATLGIEPEQNLTLSINAFREVAQIGKEQKNDADYLAAHIDMGTNYRELARWGIAPGKNLEAAVTALKEAALFESPEKGYAASIQNNLGLSYQAFAQWGIEQKKNLESSITAFNEAAKFEKSQKNTKGYAEIQHNLGMSYQALAQWGIEPKRNLKQSIATLEEAARIRKEDKDDAGYAQTEFNIGTSYRALAQQGVEPESSLHQAIAAFQETSKMGKTHDSLGSYATAQNELGVTYKELANRGVDPEKNIQRAIAFHAESAKIWKDQKNGTPGYVMAQNHLGLNYQALADRGIDPEENKKHADEAFGESRAPQIKPPR